MRSSKKTAIILLALATAAPVASERPRAKFEPPDGKVLLIAGQDVHSIRDYVRAVGTVPGGVAAYTSVLEAEGLLAAADNGGGIQYAQELLKAYPESALQLAIYMVDACEGVIAGDYDVSIDLIGSFIKAARRPVYVRIGYEFDLPENGYPPDDYIQAYRHIVERLFAAGVDNAAYVWHSYAGSRKRPFEDWYPGDGYVDWFAISYFDQAKDSAEAFADMAEKHGKPLMIAEAAPWRTQTNVSARAWKSWFRPFLQFIERRDVKAVSYINCNWDKIPLFAQNGWGDTRIQSNPSLLRLWKEEISGEAWLNAGPELYETLGYRPRN